MKKAQPLKKGQQLTIWKRAIKPGVYTVKAGDSLSVIAKKYNTKVAILQRLNPHINISLLKPGQKIAVG